MLKVEIEKVDYEDAQTRSYYPSQKGKEFRLCLHTPGHYQAGPITRKQLELLHKRIGQLLETKQKPTYTIGNRSSQVVSIITEED